MKPTNGLAEKGAPAVEIHKEDARASPSFAAADAAEWAQRDAVVAANALEARRLKTQRRAAVEVERRAQVGPGYIM